MARESRIYSTKHWEYQTGKNGEIKILSQEGRDFMDGATPEFNKKSNMILMKRDLPGHAPLARKNIEELTLFLSYKLGRKKRMFGRSQLKLTATSDGLGFACESKNGANELRILRILKAEASSAYADPGRTKLDADREYDIWRPVLQRFDDNQVITSPDSVRESDIKRALRDLDDAIPDPESSEPQLYNLNITDSTQSQARHVHTLSPSKTSQTQPENVEPRRSVLKRVSQVFAGLFKPKESDDNVSNSRTSSVSSVNTAELNDFMRTDAENQFDAEKMLPILKCLKLKHTRRVVMEGLEKPLVEKEINDLKIILENYLNVTCVYSPENRSFTISSKIIGKEGSAIEECYAKDVKRSVKRLGEGRIIDARNLRQIYEGRTTAPAIPSALLNLTQTSSSNGSQLTVPDVLPRVPNSHPKTIGKDQALPDRSLKPAHLKSNSVEAGRR